MDTLCTPTHQTNTSLILRICQFFTLATLLYPINLIGQQNLLPCNTRVPWVDGTFAVTQTNSTTGLSFWVNPENVENSNTSDFAVGHILLTGSVTLKVSDDDPANVYSAGDFAGFRVSSSAFSAGVFNSITITTYLNGVLRETHGIGTLVGLSVGFLSSQIDVGFTTVFSFNQIEITIGTQLGVVNYDVYYAVMEAFCPGQALACNAQTNMSQPSYPMTIDYLNTGSDGISVGNVDDPEAAISSSTTDFASLIHIAGVLGNTFIASEEEVTNYPSGTFVGFDIQNLTLVDASILNNITITSYLNDVQQEVKTGSSLLIGANALGNSGRQTVGFVTTTSVDKVKLTIHQPVSVSLGTTRVYHPVFEAFCPGPALPCNTLATVSTPAYPVYIDGANTGITGAVCALCTVIDAANLIDTDTTNFAQVNIVGVGLSTGSIGVRNQIDTYPAGTFAGFHIENASLVGANIFSGVTISTYNDGVFQESQTGPNPLVTVNTDLLVNTGEEIVGLVTTLPFDEVKISLSNLVNFNIGNTKVYGLVLEGFCPATIACNNTYYLTNPGFPAYIDNSLTGLDGLLCVACEVEDPEEVITATNTDFASISITAAALGSGSIAIKDALYTYPVGTFAGFTIDDINNYLQVDLFNTITISTWLDGNFQEQKTGSDLIDLNVIILFISPDPGVYNVGFKATLPFDEIRITVASLATVINNVDVYGAFVDTRASNGGSLLCNDAPIAVYDHVSTNEDNNVIVHILDNDSDSDSPLGTPSIFDTPSHGNASVNPDGTITYVPDPNFAGVDSFIYRICDNGTPPLCDTALVIVNVNAINDAPVAVVDAANTAEDTPVTVNVLNNDSDVDSPLGTPVITDNPSHGTASVNGDGSITYTPNLNFTGLDSLIYQICDNGIPPLCDTALVIFNVVAVNDPPLAVYDHASTNEDIPVTIPVLNNDSDPDSPLNAPVITDTPTHGMVVVNGDNTITYTPDPEFSGVDSFIYRICDNGTPPLCDTALVIINVNLVNDPPVAVNDVASTNEDMSVVIDVLNNDSDPDSPLGIPTVVGGPSNGTVTLNPSDSTFLYVPNPNFNGIDSFSYYICDNGTPPLCDVATVIISIAAVDDTVECNAKTPLVLNLFPVSETHSASGLSFWVNTGNVVNSNTSDFATGNILVTGSLSLTVSDATNTYPAGYFAGFVISSGLLSAGIFNSITITTYLGASMQESHPAVDLIGLSSAFLNGPVEVGFVTNSPFNKIQITITNALGLGTYNVYYPVIEKFCAGPALACNAQTRMIAPAFPVTVDYGNTGSDGISVGTVDNPQNAVSASTTDFASLNNVASVLGSTYLAVEEEVLDYPAGVFVGFDIENLTLLGAGVLNYITITSYLNGVMKEEISGPDLLVSAPLLGGSGRHTVGFVTTTQVDEVKITINQPVGVTLGTTRVYSAIFQKLCPGPALDCNVISQLTNPTYPVLIEMQNTGLTGPVCGGCNVIESGNVIDSDNNNYAQIILTAGVLTTGSIAVKDQLSDYPAGTFAGFRIENANLVDVNALSGITVSTYLGGSQQESQTNAGSLVSVASGLLLNEDQQIVGFVTTMPFDEVKIKLANTVSLNVGTTRVYNLVLEGFCPAEIACDTTYFPSAPASPVYIDAFRTGVDGLACVLCSVNNAQNVITADTSDYATITVVANVANTSSIAVADALYTYPQGTIAGFVIEDLGFLLQADLFESLTISTYNNGILQESKTGTDLLDVALIVLFISDDSGRYNVGFESTMPFDEIRIKVGSLVAAINQIRVYSAFVDTRHSNGGTLLCINGPVAVDDTAITNEDTPKIIDVLNNDMEGDSPIGPPAVLTPPDHGTATVNADSTITYTPAHNFVGLDTFTYVICDLASLCDTASVIVTVRPVIDTIEVTITDDTTYTACANNVTTFTVPATSIALCGNPDHGMLSITGTCVMYDPDSGFSGMDTFCVVVCHPTIPDLCDTTIVIVNVIPSDEGPFAEDDVAITDEDVPVVIDVLNNDSDPDSPLGIPIVVDPPSNGSASVNSDSTITYIPDPNFVGVDTFSYAICDNGLPDLCDTALVIVTVYPVTDTIRETIPEDSILMECANDLTVFNVPATSISICGLPDHGVLIPTQDCVTYHPSENYVGQDTFCVLVCHPTNPLLCDTTIVVVTITPVNDAPDAVTDHATTDEGVPVVIDVLNNDSDPDSPLGIPVITDDPSNGTVTVNPDSTITYVPDPDFVGIDTFIYQICDNAVPPLCDTALVIIRMECGALLVNVFLEGPYSTATHNMTTLLNVNHLLPGQDVLLGPSPFAPFFGASTPPGQPYDILPWNYLGSEGDRYGDPSTNPGSIPYAPDITDWVFVSVREGDTLASSEIYKCAGILHSDGTVEIPPDCGCLDLTASGPYYIVIHHRNHLPVMSNALHPLNGILTHDFRAQNSWIGELFPGFPFGTGQKQVEPGIWAMLAGNGQTNPILEEYDLNSADFTNWNIKQNIILHYLSADHNLDADVNSVDNTIWRTNFNNVTLIPH
ncbi:MAG: Ig-like domain-containing protein [Saprospiraceae bacterium]